VPPGCYVVFAGWSPPPVLVPPFGNQLTQVQVVRLNCGDHACVTLFSPSLHQCGTWFASAVTTQIEALEKAKIDAKAARGAVQTVQALLERVPRPRLRDAKGAPKHAEI